MATSDSKDPNGKGYIDINAGGKSINQLYDFAKQLFNQPSTVGDFTPFQAQTPGTFKTSGGYWDSSGNWNTAAMPDIARETAKARETADEIVTGKE